MIINLRARSRKILAFLLLSVLAAAETPFFTASIPPGALSPGTPALIEFILHYPDSGAVSVPEIALPPGLRLLSLSIEPYSDSILDSGPKRTRILLSIGAENPGDYGISRIEIAGPDFSIPIGPLSLSFSVPDREKDEIPEWKEFRTPFVYESLALFLVSRKGKLEIADLPAQNGALLAVLPGASEDASPELGLLLCPLKAERITLQGISVDTEEGRVVLPALNLVPKPLPPELSSTRAIGRFSTALEREGGIEGEGSLSLRLTISGEGNFPCILSPDPSVKKEGKVSSAAKFSARRSDSYKAGLSGYSGELVFSFDFSASSPGSYEVAFPAFISLDPNTGRLVRHALPVFSFTASPPPSPDPRTLGDAGDLIRAALAQGKLPLLEEALTLYGEGRRIEALARLKTARRERFLDGMLEAAEGGIESELKILGEPRFGLIPPPRFFLIPLSVFLAVAVTLGVLAARRRTAILTVSFTLSLALLLLAAAAAGFALWDSRKGHALLLVSSVLPIPEAGAENPISALPGSELRLEEFSGEYALVRLADGREGWARREDLAFY